MSNDQIIVIASMLAWPGIGLGGYMFGWWWRGRASRTLFASRPMTADERKHFDAAFRHMNRAFDELKHIKP